MTAATATLTSKYQITIPKELREDLKVKTGDKLIFIKKGDEWRLLSTSADGMDLIKYLGRDLKKGVDIMKLHAEFEADDEYR